MDDVEMHVETAVAEKTEKRRNFYFQMVAAALWKAEAGGIRSWLWISQSGAWLSRLV